MTASTKRFMPPEWAPHEATWMGFPREAYPGAGVSDDEVAKAWTDVANIISEFEPLHMLCHSAHLGRAERLLSSAVTLHSFDYNDAWFRDSGPTFVSEDGKLKAVDWIFNGWGDNTDFAWQPDALVARHIAEILGIEVIDSPIINEGGGIAVNGLGDVFLTKTVQLDPDRNPGKSSDDIEAEIHRCLGTEQTHWFERGLWRDYQPHGTRGHVDMIAAFAPDGSVLVHRQFDESHPDQSLWADHCDVIETAGFKVRAMPAPRVVKDNYGWVDYSYVNHYIANDLVLVPAFNDRTDEHAVEILKDVYSDRNVLSYDSRVIFAMGGGIHCITQQQPTIA